MFIAKKIKKAGRFGFTPLLLRTIIVNLLHYKGKILNLFNFERSLIETIRKNKTIHTFIMNAYRHIAGLLVAITVACSAYAQSYYDDDIYYNADKAKKEKAEKAKSDAQKRSKTGADSYVTPLPGSDSYTVYTDNTRDVDEYNRRYSNSIAADTTKANGNYESEDFACTKQIERFYNDQIVSGSGDENLIEYYSDSQLRNEPLTYNITVVNATDFWAPYYWSVYRPYGWYPSWGFSYYDPWAAGWYNGYLAWDYSYYYGFGHWHNYYYPYYPSYCYPYHHHYGHYYGNYGYQRPSYGGMMTHRGNSNNRYSGSNNSGRYNGGRYNGGRYNGGSSSYGNRNSGYNTGGAVRDNRRSYNNDNSGNYNNRNNSGYTSGSNSGYNPGYNSGSNNRGSSYNRGGSSYGGGSSYRSGGSGSYGGGGGMRGTGGRRR